MKKLNFIIETSLISASHDAAYVNDPDHEDIIETLRDAIWQAVRLDIEVTIDGVTMPAAMWEDPNHWSEDWAEKLGIDIDDVPEAVLDILSEAITES
jgi:hypothetical protein